ncbi:MAG: Gfo/Idh/MocA family oxidoreductase [Gemmatimonadales bacterium]|nr:Gfo/Idh/MocA family oxidoreductase [Gemmatimonadales bacterium]
MALSPLRTAVVGCGLIGRRRALVAASEPASRCAMVIDTDASVAHALAAETGATAGADWRAAVSSRDVDAVVVATPNAFLADVAVAALEAGKHVLVEKPMGRDLAEARRMADAAATAGRVFKVGFNHRYHPALREAHRRFVAGDLGRLVTIRARYGHGGRPGYEKEWRGDRRLAGGGELTDQGVHVLDLIHWFAGLPSSVYGMRQTAVWPLGDLEDNGYGLLAFPGGAVAMLHTSWTQWRNLFSFEVSGTDGAAVCEGLGRSYGIETLTVHRRRPEGGVPETTRLEFPGEDSSWRDEWLDFLAAVRGGDGMLGTAEAGVAVMRMLDALYRSADAGAPVAP